MNVVLQRFTTMLRELSDNCVPAFVGILDESETVEC